MTRFRVEVRVRVKVVVKGPGLGLIGVYMRRKRPCGLTLMDSTPVGLGPSWTTHRAASGANKS